MYHAIYLYLFIILFLRGRGVTDDVENSKSHKNEFIKYDTLEWLFWYVGL